MQELLILKDSPEKLAKETMNMAFSNERKVGEFTREPRGYEEFLMIQSQRNNDTELRLKRQQEASQKLADDLAAL